MEIIWTFDRDHCVEKQHEINRKYLTVTTYHCVGQIWRQIKINIFLWTMNDTESWSCIPKGQHWITGHILFRIVKLSFKTAFNLFIYWINLLSVRFWLINLNEDTCEKVLGGATVFPTFKNEWVGIFPLFSPLTSVAFNRLQRIWTTKYQDGVIIENKEDKTWNAVMSNNNLVQNNNFDTF